MRARYGCTAAPALVAASGYATETEYWLRSGLMLRWLALGLSTVGGRDSSVGLPPGRARGKWHVRARDELKAQRQLGLSMGERETRASV